MRPDLRSGGDVVATLGGRDVHLVVQPGRGTPVVLLGGCGVPAVQFAEVVGLLAGRWVVSVDRPGMVATRWPGRLPSLAEEVETLAELCAVLGEPAVVVAHSMAGPHAEALARQEPAALRGLVLLDGSVERDARRPVPGGGALWLAVARAVRSGAALPALARLGPLAEQALSAWQSNRRRLADPATPQVRAMYRRPDTLAMVVAEQAAYAGQLWDLEQRRQRQPWPGTPTLVLTATGDEGPEWVELQRDLADWLGGRQLVIEDSRHMIMLDRPDIVAEAVETLAGPLPPGSAPGG